MRRSVEQKAMCISRFIVDGCAEVRRMNTDNDVQEVDRGSGDVRCEFNSRVEIVDEVDEARQFCFGHVSNTYTIINVAVEKRWERAIIGRPN